MMTGIDPDYATVGGMLLASEQIDSVQPWLRPGDFARPLCGEVYEHLLAMRAGHRPVDPVTVLGELRRHGRVRQDGYPATELIAMVETVPAAAMTPHYAQLVLENAVFRQIERCGTRTVQIGRTRRGTPDEALDTASSVWRDLADVRDRWQLSNPTRRPLGRDSEIRAVIGREVPSPDRGAITR